MATQHFGKPNEPRVPTRILSFQTSAAFAGSGLINYSIITTMDRKEFHVGVCFLLREGDLTSLYRSLGYEVTHLNYMNLKDLVPVFFRARKVFLEGYDIVHCFGLKASLIARLLVSALKLPTKIVVGQHSVDGHRTWLHSSLDRITSRSVSMYVSNSRAGALTLQEREKIPLNKIKVIPNGLNALEFKNRRDTSRESRCGIPCNLICVAHLRRAKGYPDLIKALHILDGSGQAFFFQIVGEGPVRSQISRLLKKFHLTEKVAILGERKDIKRLLESSDIFVLASLWEGMPGAIMEAMASELPVVATNVGGVPELVADGISGFLVPPGSPELLAEKISELISKPGLRRQMGAEGLRIIKAKYALEDKVEDLERLYKSVCRKDLLIA